MNLAVGNAVKHCKVMKDALETTYEVLMLAKYSSKRNTALQKLKESLAPDTPGFRTLCPTSWTVRADSLKSVIDNYCVLQELWQMSKDYVSDPAIKGRIIGVQFQFKTFRYLFEVALGQLILRHSDNLSKTLQSHKLSAAEGQRIALMTVATLNVLRDDTQFDLLWKSLQETRTKLDVDDPVLPRKRKVPRRYEEGSAETEFFDVCKPLYCQQYYEALDLILNAIQARFDQPGFKMYRNLQDLLLKAVKGDDYRECLNHVTSLYHDDLDAQQLQLHLVIFQANFRLVDKTSVTVYDIRDYILSLSPYERDLVSEVVISLKLIMVLPSTNAVSERSFSALKRLKTYLRSTMKQDRLNHLLLLHVHKDRTDSMSLTHVAEQFVSSPEHRLSVFGRFS